MRSTKLNPLINLQNFFQSLDGRIKGVLSDKVYIVGGALRDAVIGRDEIVDIDLIVPRPEAVVEKISKILYANCIILDEKFGVYRLFPRGLNSFIDITKMQGNNIYEDLSRRDFTVNAVAAVFKDGDFEIIDPFYGIDDIKNHVIRKIERKNFIEDPLRILRAFRFNAELGFEIERETLKDLTELRFLLRDAADERVKGELLKILKTGNAGKCFSAMTECGLTDVIFPFLSSYRGFSPGKSHSHDLLEHSLSCMRNIEEFQKKGFPVEINADLLEIELEDDAPVYALYKLAGLIHDAGKLFSKKNVDGKLTFYEHEAEGERYIAELFKCKKFSNRSVEFLEKLVRYHMYPFHIINSGPDSAVLSPRVFMKLKKELGDFVPFMFNLYIADTMATSEDGGNLAFIQKALDLHEQYRYYDSLERERPPLLNGGEIMEALHVPGGPLVGKFLKELREAELSGAVKTKEDALLMLKTRHESCD